MAEEMDMKEEHTCKTHFNRLSAADDELLALLSEECAEVIQVVSKIQRHGLNSRNPHDPSARLNHELLSRELGDLLAAVLLLECRIIKPATRQRATISKLVRLPEYLHHAVVPDGLADALAAELENEE